MIIATHNHLLSPMICINIIFNADFTLLSPFHICCYFFTVLALYQDHHPEFVQYIYLFAPISLALLNPAAFLSLEIQRNGGVKNRESPTHNIEGGVVDQESTPSTPSEGAGHGNKQGRVIAWRVLKGFITNPVMVMSVLGIAANFAFQRRLPPTLGSILSVLGDSFSATALFYLGTNMVGKFSVKSGYYFVVPTLLVSAKL